MKPPRRSAPSLAKMVGGMPLPPKLGKPPTPRFAKPLAAEMPKHSPPRPRAPQSARPATAARGSIAARLGTFRNPGLRKAPPHR